MKQFTGLWMIVDIESVTVSDLKHFWYFKASGRQPVDISFIFHKNGLFCDLTFIVS